MINLLPAPPVCPTCGTVDGYVPDWHCDVCDSEPRVPVHRQPEPIDISDRDGFEDWVVDPETGSKS